MVRSRLIRVHEDIHQKLKGMAIEKKMTCAALVEQMLLAYFRWNNIDFKFKPKKEPTTYQIIKRQNDKDQKASDKLINKLWKKQ